MGSLPVVSGRLEAKVPHLSHQQSVERAGGGFDIRERTRGRRARLQMKRGIGPSQQGIAPRPLDHERNR